MKKRFGLLTGHVVLLDVGGGKYDCSNALRCSKAAFRLSRVPGQGQPGVRPRTAGRIERLKKNNDTMRERLLAAQQAKAKK